MRARTAFPALVLAAGLVLTACSSDDHGGMKMDGNAQGGSTMPHGDKGMAAGDGTTTTISIPDGAEFNATDVAFAQGMIPHHGQAIEMADQALEISTNTQVRNFAEKIKAAQAPEIEMLQGWLRAWDQPVPQPNEPMDHSKDGMGGMMMSGMMSSADMERLGNASGQDFDRMFLQMMIEHHRGAVEMAQTQLDDGKYQPAKDLAQTIIATQQKEIDEMNAVLASLG